MPLKKGAAKKAAPVVSDDASDSHSTSSGSIDDHISPSPPPAITAKNSKGLPKRMGSTLSDGVVRTGGPPIIQYVNQLGIDEESVLSMAEEREDVEGFCRNLVEDLADMVQESIYASLMDRMAVPWTVQEVILELYMGMYFSVVDRDVEFPPALDEGGQTLAGAAPKELFTLCDSDEFSPHHLHGGLEHPSLSETQNGITSTTAGSPTFGSSAVSLVGAGSRDTIALPTTHDCVLGSTRRGSATAGPHLPADFYCKFDPVSFGERNPGATSTKPIWASAFTPSGMNDSVDDWSTDDASTDEGSPTNTSSSILASTAKKRPVRDQPAGFIIVQKKLRKRQATATKLGIVEGPGGRSSPTAIRRQRVMNTPKSWDLNGTTVSNAATPSGASLSLSQADGGSRTPPRNPEETGRLVECVRAVSTKERVELESRLLHFQQGGDGLDEGGDKDSLSSSASGNTSTKAPALAVVAPVPSKGVGGAPPTILKRTNTGKPTGAASTTASVVRIVSRANSSAPASSDPHNTSTDPLAGIRRVLSNGDDNAPSTAPPPTSEDPASRTSSGRKGTGVVLAEKRSTAALNSPTSLNSVNAPFAAERSGSIEIEISSPVSTPPPKHGARRLSISATGQISSFRPSQGPQRRAGGGSGTGGGSGSPLSGEIPPIVGVSRAVSSSSTATAVPVTTTDIKGGARTRKQRQSKKKAPEGDTNLRNVRDSSKASHYFYRDPLLGPQWSDVFLSVPEPPHIPPDSWSRGLLPSRRPILSDLDSTSLFLGGSLANTTIMRGSRAGGRSGSGKERSASPQAHNGTASRFNASTASTDDIPGTRRRSSLLVPTTTTTGSSRPASRAAASIAGERPGSRNRAAIPKPSNTPSPASTPTDAPSLDKKVPTKTPTATTKSSKTKGSAHKTPPTAATDESDELLPMEGGPKSQLALLQRLELSEDDLKIQREEQRVKDRMAQLRNTSDDINKQLAALKPKTPFTVDLKSGMVLVQKRPEGVKMEPVPGSICGGPTVLGGKRITTPEEEQHGTSPVSPLDQLLEEQLRLRSQAANDKNNPKTRRAQTAPLGSGNSPARGGIKDGGSQVIRIVEDLEEERRQRAELTAQLEKLDIKELKDASTAQEAINASIGGVSSIAGGGSPPRTRPGTAVEMDVSQQRPKGKKLPPSHFYEVEKRVETPMIARAISPVGGVMTKIGDVISVSELTIPTVTPNGGRPMSRSEFTRLQQGNSQGSDPNDAKDTAAYWQGELSGASRVAPRAAATGGGALPPRPNSTPLTLGNPSAAAAAARSESATPSSGVRQPKGLVQRLSSAVTKQGGKSTAGEDGETNTTHSRGTSSGGVRGLLDRVRTTDPTTSGPAAKRAFTPMSKQRKGVYVPPAHRVSSQSGIGTSTSPSRGRIGTPTSIVELA